MIAFEFFIWIIFGILYFILGNSILMFIPLFISTILILLKKDKNNSKVYFVICTLYSLIIPNNYIILLYVLLIPIFFKNMDKNKSKIFLFLVSFILFVCLNSLLNEFLIINKLFSLLYLIPIFFCFNITKLELNDDNYFILKKYLVSMLYIQLAFIGINLITNFSYITSMLDFDWVTGSFGMNQGNVFFFFIGFCCVFFINDYFMYKKSLKYVIFSIILMILTGSITLIILFLLSFFNLIFFKNISSEIKKSLIFFTIFGTIIFMVVTPTWIKSLMIEMFTTNKIETKINKITDYHNVFFELPKENIKYFFIGNGIGQYSSRSALTCTGNYIDFYNNYFEPSITLQTSKWIIPRYEYALKYQLGTLNLPYSSIITIQGEMGLIGLLFFLSFCRYLLKNSSGFSKCYVLFFIFACFSDNYLEFAKVVFVLYLSLSLCRYNNLKRE